MIKPLAAKELRTRFAEVIEEVQKGTHFILIYRSKPVGELRPLAKMGPGKKKVDPFSFWLNPPKELLFSSKKSAVQLIREDRGKS